MRLSKHINEVTEPLPINIINELMKVNVDYLKDVKLLINFPLHFLTRGTHDTFDYAVKKPRKDRKPTDSNLIWHNALDNEFNKKFKIKVRSEAVFCAKLSVGYGSSNYMVFPIGKFYMIYSNKYPDLFLEQPNSVHDMQAKAEMVVSTCIKATHWDVVCRDIELIHEVMLICNSYLLVKKSYWGSVDQWIKNEVD